jgi:heparinase II/III-like protein
LLDGRVGILQATREGFRRGQAAYKSRQERASLEELDAQPARLSAEFQKLSPADLLKHFCRRTAPRFFAGFENENIWSSETGRTSAIDVASMVAAAEAVAKHRWPLLGFGEKDFDHPINWHRDPLSGRIWPLDYHADISLWHRDGSDIRVLWELNRLGHLVTLGRAYVLTRANRAAEKNGEARSFDQEFFLQLESWQQQNPLGRGANWACAMEVALRAINLLAAFALFKNSPALTKERLLLWLKIFDQHGAHIRRNLEFSHVTTSNHYLSDVAGLLWLGIMLPELQSAAEWRDWALAELLREMDKQVLADGADYEGATGYHRFVLELFFYSFLLCRANQISIPEKYWLKLHAMLAYLRGILRPDGTLPLVGDYDDGAVFAAPTGTTSELNLLAIGAAAFKDPQFKLTRDRAPAELLWILGEEGLQDYEALDSAIEETPSQAFPDAGIYVLRQGDLALLFSTGNQQKGSPTSHRHNDVLSVEVSAHGRTFIVDPGTYVYTADLHERQLFRSTAYHSTIQIDNEEQQTIHADEPFKNGAEAKVRVLEWTSTKQQDRVIAEHTGYERLREPVTHRRAITFDKGNGWWFIEDELGGRGDHAIAARFHFDAELEVGLFDEQSVLVKDPLLDVQLFVCFWGARDGLRLELEPQFVSRNYGSKLPSMTACWSIQTSVPYKLYWAIVPVGPKENLEERLKILRSPESNVQIGRVV